MASRTAHRKQTVIQGLGDLGIVTAEFFADCTTRDAEFKLVKKQYFRLALEHHPDKGGDAELFRTVQTSFELLRDLHTGKQRKKGDNWLFSEYLSQQKTSKPVSQEEVFDMHQYDFDFSNQETPSWEYYEAAAEEEMPLYRVELAKSGRSRCKATGKYQKCDQRTQQQDSSTFPSTELLDPHTAPLAITPEVIQQGEIRVGWLNGQSGTYGGWKHLRCWRVPYKVWMGLPEPEKCQDREKFASALLNNFNLCGFDELPEPDQQTFVEHCLQRSNWAAYRKPKKSAIVVAPPNAGPSVPGAAAAASSSSLVINEGALVAKHKFVMPQPGVNGASGPTVFAGKTFVCTGVFPEVGGGAGLSLGKDRVKAMLQAFGGRVTGSVSGKTDVLVVGKEPGMSKVSQARSRPKIFMASIKDVKDGLDAGLETLEEFAFYNREEPMRIASFSAGYSYSRTGFNGKALTASAEEMAIAQGLRKTSPKTAGKKAPPASSMVCIEDDKKPAAEPTSADTKKKRKALKDVPAEPNVVVEDIKRASKKRRKTAPRAAPKADQKSSTALVVASKKKSKSKKTAKKQAGPKSKEDDDMEDVITCDICGEECTEESWYKPDTKADYCPDCHAEKSIEDTIPQRYGHAVE